MPSRSFESLRAASLIYLLQPWRIFDVLLQDGLIRASLSAREPKITFLQKISSLFRSSFVSSALARASLVAVETMTTFALPHQRATAF